MIACGCSWDYPVWYKSKKSDTALFRFVLNEKGGVGYVDRDGKVVIPPTLSASGNFAHDDFFDGLAKVRMNEESWYIDATGKRVLRADYFDTGQFSEGLASVAKGGKEGYFNREGKIITQPAFDTAYPFSEGLAIVGLGQSYGYIRKDGGFAIEPKYVLAMPFSDGAARVIERGACLYIGYGPCDDFNPRRLPDARNIIPPPLELPRCKYSYIDGQGKRLFESDYQEAKDFVEGLAPVGDGKKWGYVDRKGSVVIPFRYENAEPFAEGLARVRVGWKWGFIDKTGKLVVPAEFNGGLDFSEGLAVVGD